jgi:hypothetical protein
MMSRDSRQRRGQEVNPPIDPTDCTRPGGGGGRLLVLCTLFLSSHRSQSRFKPPAFQRGTGSTSGGRKPVRMGVGYVGRYPFPVCSVTAPWQDDLAAFEPDADTWPAARKRFGDSGTLFKSRRRGVLQQPHVCRAGRTVESCRGLWLIHSGSRPTALPRRLERPATAAGRPV